MIHAACHCGAVRFELEAAPTWVLDCNCTLCRKYGAMWCYVRGEGAVTVTTPPTPGATETYQWLDGDLAFHRCKVCGCITHMVAAKADPPAIYGLNARMMAGLDPAQVRVRRIDNSHSGFFWTRPDEPVLKSRHPPMPPPTFEDWR